MKFYEDKQRILYNGDCQHMVELDSESVQCAVTSPPYWGLRKYEGNQDLIWGGDNCEHVWGKEIIATGHRAGETNPGKEYYTKNSGQWSNSKGNFCQKCGAWKGQFGLEPTPEMYVQHTVQILREIRRVLRKDGVVFWNIGDSYAGGKGTCFNPGGGKGSFSTHGDRKDAGVYPLDRGNVSMLKTQGLKPKDLCLIPFHIAIAAQQDGWWIRSDIIWCLSGGTYIYVRSQKGDMPMTARDLARLEPSTVKLWNGEKWIQLKGMSKSARLGNELEIVLRSGERISCTPAHKFPTSKGLLPASDLNIGDIIDTCLIPEPDNPKAPAHIGLDAAWLAGLYIAEGSKAGDTIQIAGHSKKEARWQRLEKIATDYGGYATRTIKGNNMSIRLYGKVLCALLDELVSGKSAKDKGFANVVWRYGNNFINEMLQGYLDGDGSWDESNKRWRLGFMRNYNLERDLRTASARLGYRLTLNLASVPYNGKRNPTFRGEIRFERSGHRNEKPMSEIITINKARCREVYDIGVEDEPHLFSLASGVLTHNSKPNPMPESVSDRPTKPFPGAHFAVFPEKLPELCIKAATSEKGCCPKCGALWARVLDKKPSQMNIRVRDARAGRATPEEGYKATEEEIERYPGNHPDMGYRQTIGWKPTCSCGLDPVPCTVLDPFAGSGTTLLVATKLGRKSIGYELSEDYCKMTVSRNRQGAL